MAYINFRKVKLADWNSMNSMNKDPNTRYTVFNTDGTIFGEFIGIEPIDIENLELDAEKIPFGVDSDVKAELERLENDKADKTDLTAENVKYNNAESGLVSENVKDAIDEIADEVLAPSYITATHEALQTEITATDAFEINDETGDVVKITGNEPTSIVTNGDLTIPSSNPNVPQGFSHYNATNITLSGGIATFTPTAQYGYFATSFQHIIGTKYYTFARYKTDSNLVRINNPVITSHSGSNTYELVSNVFTAIDTRFFTITDTRTSGFTPISVDYIGAYNVTDMITKGIKNDNGIPFSDLTNEEIKSQLDIWVENGFPTVVEKLVSKSDNLLDGTFNKITSLESENVVSNGNFLHGSTDWRHSTNNEINQVTFANGKVTLYSSNATNYLGISQNDKLVVDNLYYLKFDIEKRAGNLLSDSFTGTTVSLSAYKPSGTYSFVSRAISTILRLQRWSGSGVHDFDLDNIYCFNITDLVNRGILPGGLTNAQYKELLDNKMFDNVPLRETDYISVEPSKSYKLIRVSDNVVTHKVIEYTQDDQVVRVNTVTYAANKYTFTTHALTAKVKLISDLMKRPVQMVTNSNFNTGDFTGWGLTNGLTDAVVQNGVAIINTTTAHQGITQNKPVVAGRDYYYSWDITSSNRVYFEWAFPYSTSYQPSGDFGKNKKYSFIKRHTASGGASFYVRNHASTANTVHVRSCHMYDITNFISAGVVNDTGTPFSRLTNDEIIDQMDIWTEAGFPDHVIHALYPNGVDSAIALKYNDADDVFRPQSIDTLPLNLTLRSGEYWQDGYVVKQNGNAEYYPLNTKFSAWNYGQLEAVYTSGVPADFDIRYAQNTASQVKTTQEFLVEAREQIDYVTEGYDNLVEKLGDAIFSDKYDSYAGITSDTYEYYTLEGIKEGNTLAIEGAGQSIQNLLGKGGTINATTTVRGVTVTYDKNTGVFTANGTATAGTAFNITLATGIDFGLPVGTPIQLMRYYDGVDSGTVNLNGSYIGYVLLGTAVSNRINENSEALYDPYINGSGNLTANHATNKQQLLLQVWAPGIVFTNFKFKIGIYEGLQLRPFILPSGEPAKSNVVIYNRTANMLNMPTALSIEDNGLTLTYDPLAQEFLLSGTATATKDISLSATFNVLSGDRLSIKRLYQSGDITAAGGTLPRIKLVNSTNTTIVYNDIYKMTAPEGETPTPDVSFNTGTAPADDTLTLKLGITSGQVFDNYRFRLMIHDKSTDIGYVAYRKDQLGNISVGANERAVIEFKAIPYGILEFVADSQSLNLLYADSITDLNKTYLEYNAGIISPNRKISELTARAELIDNPFRNKVIAVWGDSRESNNPTSDPTGVGDQKDTSWPALLAKKLGATVLNYGLSGGAWAENTFQQDAASAIVNRVQTEDISASADVIVISSMNDFKLASVLGSPLPSNKDKTTFYGAMRLTYDRLATKYPGKKIVLVLPQKRYDEDVNYGGGSYYHYLKAQVEVANEYGIPIVDLYHNFPNAKPTFYATNMLNDTHFSAAGNDLVAELVTRELIGNGNKGDMDLIPPIPTTDGTYTLKVTITGGIPVFTWVVD